MRPPYPKGVVIGPCVCGSWPGGPCFKCTWRSNKDKSKMLFTIWAALFSVSAIAAELVGSPNQVLADVATSHIDYAGLAVLVTSFATLIGVIMNGLQGMKTTRIALEGRNQTIQNGVVMDGHLKALVESTRMQADASARLDEKAIQARAAPEMIKVAEGKALELIDKASVVAPELIQVAEDREKALIDRAVKTALELVLNAKDPGRNAIKPKR